MTWPTISAALRLRTQGCVPVWQNEQDRVQPTWEETHSAPRSVSGMKTVSACLPSAKPTSHFRARSAEISSRATVGREMKNASPRSARSGLASVVISSNEVAPRR